MGTEPVGLVNVALPVLGEGCTLSLRINRIAASVTPHRRCEHYRACCFDPHCNAQYIEWAFAFTSITARARVYP